MKKLFLAVEQSAMLLALFGAMFIFGMFAMRTVANAQVQQKVAVTVTASAVPIDAKAVHICLWTGKKNFPICSTGASHHQKAAKSGAIWKATFRNIPAGSYAISGFADMNGNGKLDRSFVGRPNEPVGISIKERPKGRPSFNYATIEIAKDLSYNLVFRSL